jgi:uncharacterized protein YutE (UPF0331/DUF86 family)
VTKPDLIAKKLAEIETYVAQLRAHGKPQDIARDVVQERFIEHTLQIAIQAALDVAAHIVSDDRLGEPRSQRELFEILARNHWLSDEMQSTLSGVVGFRNVVVHGYDAVDLDVVREIAERHVGDLLDFVAEIRARLAE